MLGKLINEKRVGFNALRTGVSALLLSVSPGFAMQTLEEFTSKASVKKGQCQSGTIILTMQGKEESFPCLQGQNLPPEKVALLKDTLENYYKEDEQKNSKENVIKFVLSSQGAKVEAFVDYDTVTFSSLTSLSGKGESGEKIALSPFIARMQNEMLKIKHPITEWGVISAEFGKIADASTLFTALQEKKYNARGDKVTIGSLKNNLSDQESGNITLEKIPLAKRAPAKGSHGMLIFSPDGKELIGGVTGIYIGKENRAQLSYLFVDAKRRGLNVGGTLVKRFESLSKGYGAKTIQLQTIEGTDGFYKKCGYTVIQKRGKLVDMEKKM